MDVVAFAQVPGKAPIITKFVVPGESFAILLEGVVWVDPPTYRIVRLRRDLLALPPKSHLARETTQINCGEVRFKEVPTPVFLSRDVVVTVDWKGHLYRNRHRHSDLNLFGAKSTIKPIE